IASCHRVERPRLRIAEPASLPRSISRAPTEHVESALRWITWVAATPPRDELFLRLPHGNQQVDVDFARLPEFCGSKRIQLLRVLHHRRVNTEVRKHHGISTLQER